MTTRSDAVRSHEKDKMLLVTHKTETTDTPHTTLKNFLLSELQRLFVLTRLTHKLDGDATDDVHEGDSEPVAGDCAHHGDNRVTRRGLVGLLVDGGGAGSRAAGGVVQEHALQGTTACVKTMNSRGAAWSSTRSVKPTTPEARPATTGHPQARDVLRCWGMPLPVAYRPQQHCTQLMLSEQRRSPRW